MNKIILSVIFYVFTCSALANALTSEQEIINKLEELKSLKTHFTQRVLSPTGQLLQIAKGIFFLRRPMDFRWEVSSPYQQILFNKQDELWVYDADLSQVIVHSFDNAISGTPLAFLIEPQLASKQFSSITKRNKGVNTLFEIEMLEQAQDGVLSKVFIEFSQTTPIEMILLDKLGQQTIITFSEQNVNPILLDNIFEVALPKKVDIIKQ